LGVLYVVSAEEAAGKTAICAGLGNYMQGEGKKVGYLKLLDAGTCVGDVAFMKQVLDLPEAADSLCPPADDTSKIKEVCDRAAQGKDIVIVEGRLGENASKIAGNLNAKVIAVEAYTGQASGFIESYKGFGKSLLGIVVNKVPESQLKSAQEAAAAEFSKAGINLLGVLPENRVLFAISVGELADNIQGKILNNAEKSAELIENFMLGAMVVDSGLDYFGRKSNKAAVIRQDRPDMQLAALETSTRCLVLTGSNEPPIYNVLQKAESRGIPIVLTGTETSDIVAGIEDALSKSRFNQEQKLKKLADIMKQNLDLKAVL